MTTFFDQTRLIQTLNEDLKHALPTPLVGETVQWYPDNQQNNPHAAIVTANEEFGRCALTVFGRNAEPKCVVGVFHKDWPGHSAGNPNTRKQGSWDYPGGHIPKGRMQPHLDSIEGKLRKANAEQQLFEKQEAARKKAEKDAQEAAKKQQQEQLAAAGK